jgi:hypothetical protein
VFSLRPFVAVVAVEAAAAAAAVVFRLQKLRKHNPVRGVQNREQKWKEYSRKSVDVDSSNPADVGW